ncbi:MAG: fibronectin type III domain-containing protein [Bacteroidales bacterium]|nr:fibronectin type III domain-containing protein [Bacteroidales bacterium]
MNRFLSLFLLPLAILSCGKAPVEDGGTAAVKLSAPTNVKLHKATETSLTFQWNLVEGANGYEWNLTGASDSVRGGKTSNRNVTVEGLEPGTAYAFTVRAVAGGEVSDWSAVLEASTSGSTPLPPSQEDNVVCVDAPLVVEVGTSATLGTSGLIRVCRKDGTVVDKIDMADIAKVNILEDGTMVPVETINNGTVFHTFMDALHSTRWRPVHYTPVRLEGGKLVIKLHNEALDFGGSYYLTVDASVAGKAVAKDDMPFTTKAKPSGTTVKVASDGSGDFCTVQGALSYVSTLGKNDAITIEVADGTYRELLYLRDKNNLTIKGASRGKTVIAYPNNESYATGSGAASSSKPAIGSSTGVLGGRCLFLVESCDNLVIEDLTIENTFWADDHKGQAETIYFNGDSKKLTIENCSLLSWQDTFLCKGSVWVHNSLIAGHVDFIWGYPQACLFEDCEIRSRAGGYIVQARCPAGSKGFVFLNCSITAEGGVSNGSVWLARSGGDTSVKDNVTYVNCSMTDAIAPAGWHTGKTPTPSTPSATEGWKEYGTTGVSTASRNAYGKILSAEEAAEFSSKEKVLNW